MDLKELKKKIETNNLDDNPIIFKYEDNDFICKQYANQIAKQRNLQKMYIDDLSEINDDVDMFDSEDYYLYIYEIDKLIADITSDMKNVIVICKNVPDTLSVDFTEVGKTVNWQIEDFIHYRLPGLTENQIKWLCEITKYDIFRLDNECKKIEIFPENTQKIVFDSLNSENAYADLNPMNIFNFTDAIMNRDYNLVGTLIKDIEACDLEPLGVVTTLLRKFIQVANLQLNPMATALSLGMSDKQFYYLKSHPNRNFTTTQIINNIEFLSSVDGKIKSGELDLSREELLAYFVSKVLI